MSKKLLLFITVIAMIIFVSCKLCEEETKPIEIYGCMDSTATNYNPDATIDDGSCEYAPTISSFVLITVDGGESWDIKYINKTIGDIVDISIIDSNNIWLCTYPNDFVQNAQILHTFDGGRTWEQQYYFDSPTPTIQITFEYIEMLDINNGIALANDWNNYVPMFLKTIDGGNNWIKTTTQAIGISGDIWRRVDFVDVNTGYFYENPQKLYKTTNSGITWTETNFDGQTHVLKFYNEDIGIFVYWNKIYRTIDGGESWALVDTTERGWGLDIEFDPNDPSKVWMLSGGLFFSSDTGSTWNHCFDCTDIGFDAICYSDSSLWVFNARRYLRKVDINDCSNYTEYQLPEYTHGDLILGYDFDVNGDVIVIPGRFSDF